jgi:hypothetical protein
MGMADEAREQRRLTHDSKSQRRAAGERQDSDATQWRAWVEECIPEFIAAARELKLKPDSRWLWEKTWILSIPTQNPEWPDEPTRSRPGQHIAVESDGRWYLVYKSHPYGQKKARIERVPWNELKIEHPMWPTKDTIRRAFVQRLS